MFGLYALPSDYLLDLLALPEVERLWVRSKEPKIKTMDIRPEDMCVGMISNAILCKEVPDRVRNECVVVREFENTKDKKEVLCEYLSLSLMGPLESVQKIKKIGSQAFAKNFEQHFKDLKMGQQCCLVLSSTASFKVPEKKVASPARSFDGEWRHSDALMGFVLMSFMGTVMEGSSEKRRFPEARCGFYDAREMCRHEHFKDFLGECARIMANNPMIVHQSESMLEQAELEQLVRRAPKSKMGSL